MRVYRLIYIHMDMYFPSLPHLAFADTPRRPHIVDIIVLDVMVLDSALTALP